MKLIELDLVDGQARDVLPQYLMLVEAFDETKNDNFADAKAFALIQSGGAVGHVLTETSFEAIGEAIRQSDPSDFFEITNASGNRMLLRRSTVVDRASSAEGGSDITVLLATAYQTVRVSETIAELRSIMNTPTLAEPPAGMQMVEPSPEPATEEGDPVAD